ncbi:hypothetical protein C8J48_0891 [Desmospora activa DSM 45169]|uniref:Uncharacterized protein n=2 Tax=Desmospora TaxID=500614 RepID=A0A2T4Z8W0_9BACL|nr:hypothetical protein C8J48_0891 [Desmospora activa DSM 45169]
MPMTPMSKKDPTQDRSLNGPSPSVPLRPMPLESSENVDGQTSNYAELFREQEERESSSSEL